MTSPRDDLVEQLLEKAEWRSNDVHGDLHREAATRIQQLTARAEQAEAQVERLREALLDAAAHLVGVTSAYEHYAGNSKRPGRRDPLFSTKLMDYKHAVRRARAALNAKPVEK
jgi:hypothetical protein